MARGGGRVQQMARGGGRVDEDARVGGLVSEFHTRVLKSFQKSR